MDDDAASMSASASALASCSTEVLDGVVLMPYVVLALNAAGVCALNVLWNVWRPRVLRCCCTASERAPPGCVDGCEQTRQCANACCCDMDDAVGFQSIRGVWWPRAALVYGLCFLTAQALLQVVHFWYVIATTTSGADAQRFRDNSFHAYSAAYARYVNSGVCVAVVMVAAPDDDHGRAHSDRLALQPAFAKALSWLLRTAMCVSLVPAVLTHVVPMAFGPFVWLTVLCGGVCYALVRYGADVDRDCDVYWDPERDFQRQLQREGQQAAAAAAQQQRQQQPQPPPPPPPVQPEQRLLIQSPGRPTHARWRDVLVRVVVAFVVALWLQTCFNYGVLWFSGSASGDGGTGGRCAYADIMANEFARRNTRAYFQAVADTARQCFSFVTVF